MALESTTFISGLDASNPVATDPKSQGDDHLRLIKGAVKASFPGITGAMTATHTELNFVAGVTSPLQTQLGAKAPLVNPTLTGVKEVKATMAANVIDLSAGNYFTKTIASTTTFTLSNVPAAGTGVCIVLDLTNGGAFAVTWWAGVKWDNGAAPTLTASGRDVLMFFTHDGGAVWNGFKTGGNMA